MLGKLIKYDLKALAKILAPLWGVLLVMGLIFGISIRNDHCNNDHKTKYDHRISNSVKIRPNTDSKDQSHH